MVNARDWVGKHRTKWVEEHSEGRVNVQVWDIGSAKPNPCQGPWSKRGHCVRYAWPSFLKQFQKHLKSICRMGQSCEWGQASKGSVICLPCSIHLANIIQAVFSTASSLMPHLCWKHYTCTALLPAPPLLKQTQQIIIRTKPCYC